MCFNFRSGMFNVVEKNSLFQNSVKEGRRIQRNSLPLFLLRSVRVLNCWQISVKLLLGFAALRMRTSLCVSSQSLLQMDHWLDSSSVCVWCKLRLDCKGGSCQEILDPVAPLMESDLSLYLIVC